MPFNSVPCNSEVLNSWKEIAQYLGRGVRTVQRWEQDLRLPVHRPRGRARSAVIALKPELDRWLAQTPEPNGKICANNLRDHVHQNALALRARMSTLLARSIDLCNRSRHLTEQVNRAAELARSMAKGQYGKKATRAASAAALPT